MTPGDEHTGHEHVGDWDAAYVLGAPVACRATRLRDPPGVPRAVPDDTRWTYALWGGGAERRLQ